jgi:hypothetical protein
MSLPAQVFDKSKLNCLQKCFYMMNLIRHKNIELWEMYQPVYENLKVEESWEFYTLLVDEYKKLLEAPPVKKIAKKKTAAKKPSAKKKAAPKAKKK